MSKLIKALLISGRSNLKAKLKGVNHWVEETVENNEEPIVSQDNKQKINRLFVQSSKVLGCLLLLSIVIGSINSIIAQKRADEEAIRYEAAREISREWLDRFNKGQS